MYGCVFVIKSITGIIESIYLRLPQNFSATFLSNVFISIRYTSIYGSISFKASTFSYPEEFQTTGSENPFSLAIFKALIIEGIK